MEEWKVIESFPDYEVSNMGNVRRKSTKTIRHTYLNNSGYPTIKLINNGKRISKCVHRLEAIAFLENKQEYPCINHKDGNKENNNIDNLEWCTYSYNNQHAYDHHLKEYYNYKIRPSEYCNVVEMYINKVRVKDIAMKYGVSESGIYMLLRRIRKEKKHEQIRQRYSLN